MFRIKQVLILVCVILFVTNVKCKIIIDNDAGADDAIAIFMGLLYEKYFDGPEIVALTTVNGNVEEDKVSVNNQRILKLANRQDVPIYRGSKSSLVTTPPIDYWFGLDGLGDDDEKNLEGLTPVQNKKAVEALIEQSKIHEGNLTVIAVASLSNVALALKIDPNFISRLKHLYIGAGHIHDEMYSTPEFNAHMDAEAYHIVAEHARPDKVTMFPYSTTKYTLEFDKDWRINVFGAIDTDIIRAINTYERISINRTSGWSALDPSVVAVVVKPDLVEEYKYSKNDISLCGERRGITNHEFVEDIEHANVKVIQKVKHEEYKQFLMDVFSAELKSNSKQ